MDAPSTASLGPLEETALGAGARITSAVTQLGTQWHQFDSFLRCLFGIFIVLVVMYVLAFMWLSQFRATAEEDRVDRWSLPFHICCMSLAFSTATTVAVPLTTMSYTQIANEQNSWIDAQQFVQMLWTLAIAGSDICLFVLLPFAYFYTESSWSQRRKRAKIKRNTSWGIFRQWWNQFVARLLRSLVEVTLLAAILSGIFFLIQVVIDGGELTWQYPTRVVSTAHMLPGLLVFGVFTPVGLQELMSRSVSFQQRWIMRPSTEALLNDMDQLAASSIRRKLDAARDAATKAAVRPSVGVDEPRQRSRSAHAALDLPSPQPVTMSFSDFTGEPSTPLPSTRTRTSSGTWLSPGVLAGVRRRLVAPESAQSVPNTAVARFGDGQESVAELEKQLAEIEARRTQLSEKQRSRAWLRWMFWPARAAIGWLMFLLVVALSGTVVVMAAARPFLDLAAKSKFLFDARPLYRWAFGVSVHNAAMIAFIIDTIRVLFFVMASVVGAYYSRSVFGVSLKSIRPVLGKTSMQQLIGNLTIMQLLSYSLPAAAWILGLGAFDVMKHVEHHYGHVAILRNDWFVGSFNAFFVAAGIRLVFLKAQKTLSRSKEPTIEADHKAAQD